MKVNVIGLGYIGLPTALSLAAGGTEVIGSDKDIELVNKLHNGNVSFEEKGLKELFEQANSQKLSFQKEYSKADVYIIAVPTPYLKREKKVDATYVKQAVDEVLGVCDNDAIIVIESTISPGTIDKHIRTIIEASKKKVQLVHAPERIIPGKMLYELENNNRTIGADSLEVGEKIAELYSTFCKGEITVTDIKTAEMTKVVENTYRDINIAFANELLKICREDNLDVYKIIELANKNPRVNILTPGPGVGGHCIAVDPWFWVGDYPGLANIILAARRINDSMPEFVLERAADIMKSEGIVDIDKIGIYGLTYKEDVDDVRESPTIQLIESMRKHLAGVPKLYDPFVKEKVFNNQYQAFGALLDSIEMIVIMVGHHHIIENEELLRGKVILDTRNVIKTIPTYKL